MISDRVTVIGGGLAGAALAWALHSRGVSLRWIDDQRPGTASRIAAGLMTPITGKRLAESHRWREFFPFAEGFYRSIEATTGAMFFHARPIIRAFASEAERGKFDASSDLVGPVDPPVPEGILAPFGAFAMPGAAQLDVPAYLEASWEHFAELGFAEVGSISDDALSPGERTIFCTGYREPLPIVVRGVSFRPAKGEILTLRIPGWLDARAFNRRGFWLAPANEPEVCHFGATYSWDRLDDVPTEEARRELVGELEALLNRPYEIVDQRAAVRPIAAGQLPCFGWHDADRRLGYFTGLGSKGALQAPRFAAAFATELSAGR